MSPSELIGREFERLVGLGREKIAFCSGVEQTIYFVVLTRCEIDMAGFSSVYEQALDAAELRILIAGLRAIGEGETAEEFSRGLALLEREGFYDGRNWTRLSAPTKAAIEELGQRIGARLWTLDEKLAALVTRPRAEPIG